MELREYFEKTPGHGVLATADGDGNVDGAIYAHPHFLEDGNVGFIMRDRLTHHNTLSNPHAVYIFMENTSHYKGQRLFLTKLTEEQDTERLFSLRRKDYGESREQRGPLFLVTFKIDKILPLVGSGEDGKAKAA